MIYLGLLFFVLSVYSLFIAGDAVELAIGILRSSLSIVGLVAVRFSNEMVLTMSVFLYALISILLLVVARSEVQVKDV